MSESTRVTTVCWSIIAAWTAISLISLYAPGILSANNARFVNVALLTAFTFVHGAQCYGGRGILIYFLAAVLVTNVTENLSIISGFPFGAYHHTAAMGLKIWHVPIIVGPIFAVAGYLGWVLAGIVLGDAFAAVRHGIAVVRPLVAAMITTSWDLCVDAIGGTVNRDWVWTDGGPWFGVPWMNYVGWMLTMWISFQLFAVYLCYAGEPRKIAATASYWMQPVVYWALIALQFPLLTAIVPDVVLTDPAGAEWRSRNLFQSMAIVSVFTMGFTCVLSFAVLSRARSEQSANA